MYASIKVAGEKKVQECDPDKRSGLAANEVPHCFLVRTII